MTGKNNEKVNQCRHLILAIASSSCKSKTDVNLIRLLKILIKNAEGSIKTRCQKLIRDKSTYLNSSCWMYMVCRELSLDYEENISLFL